MKKIMLTAAALIFTVAMFAQVTGSAPVKAKAPMKPMLAQTTTKPADKKDETKPKDEKKKDHPKKEKHHKSKPKK